MPRNPSPDTVHWNPRFHARHPLFAPIVKPAEALTAFRDDWPQIADYNALIQQFQPGMKNDNGIAIEFVPQKTGSSDSSAKYEPRIFLSGEVQTRHHNWHDLFQVLVWCRFPRTKSLLNAMHYRTAIARDTATSQGRNRGPLENAIALFDECGAIILSDSDELLDLVTNMQWDDLFWNNRSRVAVHLQCIVFGHAMYEKALHPYVGMTSHCVLLRADRTLLAAPLEIQLAEIDSTLASSVWPDVQSSADLRPFPLLGMPGWHPQNAERDFYLNTNYFRERRNRTRRFPSIST